MTRDRAGEMGIIEPEWDDRADGSVGYLTFEEFDRLRWAVQNALKHIPWWRVCGHIRGDDTDEKRTRRNDNPLPLPAPWLAAHEITRLLNELNRWPELEDAANNVRGAELAALLTREVETAVARWPIDDRPHKVKFFRCLACDQQTLKYFPPKRGDRADAEQVFPMKRRGEGAIRESPEPLLRPTLEVGRTVYIPVELPVTAGRTSLMDTAVRCTNKACGAVLDEAMWRRAVAMIEAEWKDKDERARRLGAG